MTQRSVSLTAPLNHPSYSGHFPGRPVLPGVVLLELVVAAIGRGVPRSVESVKFQRALLPGETFSLLWNDAGARVNFRCELDGQPVAEGSLSYGDAAWP